MSRTKFILSRMTIFAVAALATSFVPICSEYYTFGAVLHGPFEWLLDTLRESLLGILTFPFSVMFLLTEPISNESNCYALSLFAFLAWLWGEYLNSKSKKCLYTALIYVSLTLLSIATYAAADKGSSEFCMPRKKRYST